MGLGHWDHARANSGGSYLPIHGTESQSETYRALKELPLEPLKSDLWRKTCEIKF